MKRPESRRYSVGGFGAAASMAPQFAEPLIDDMAEVGSFGTICHPWASRCASSAAIAASA